MDDNLGPYCSYCEVFNSTAQVDHIVSQDQIDKKKFPKEMKYLWENFISACSKCNGKNNKTNIEVDFVKMYFLDRNNTFMAFTYKEGGFVSVNPLLSANQKPKAEALMRLVGLDKFPIASQNTPYLNPKYPKFDGRNDKRWLHSKEAWEHAEMYLTKRNYRLYGTAHVIAHIRGTLKVPRTLNRIADRREFFSVWFTVFMAHKAVKKALIDRFEGTALDCFDGDDDYNPIPRNPKNLDDPL